MVVNELGTADGGQRRCGARREFQARGRIRPGLWSRGAGPKLAGSASARSWRGEGVSTERVFPSSSGGDPLHRSRWRGDVPTARQKDHRRREAGSPELAEAIVAWLGGAASVKSGEMAAGEGRSSSFGARRSGDGSGVGRPSGPAPYSGAATMGSSEGSHWAEQPAVNTATVDAAPVSASSRWPVFPCEARLEHGLDAGREALAGEPEVGVGGLAGWQPTERRRQGGDDPAGVRSRSGLDY
ncbi:proline-rich receptor-like protein kinase PERK2 [Iris pallida]|uniref:Proline-rich receptor-like protein kinase PERK2 n=1 Tax=Iris pallida TaxID=29817 RepID=A0AAX6G0Y3_IRIPA|nr:proline-rich receptor-like protein kinase PERK2 [Iris pallida]